MCPGLDNRHVEASGINLKRKDLFFRTFIMVTISSADISGYLYFNQLFCFMSNKQEKHRKSPGPHSNQMLLKTFTFVTTSALVPVYPTWATETFVFPLWAN